MTLIKLDSRAFGTLTPSRAGSNPAIPASLNEYKVDIYYQPFFFRMTKAVSINVTPKVVEDRPLAIGLFSF